MTAQEANFISIKAYLDNLGLRPVKEKTHYGMYLSPFRQETVPSFKVDYRLNLWYDFGAGEGGTMIDLFMKINKCTFHETMLKLQTPSTIPSFSFHGKAQQATLNKTLPLTS